MVRRLIDERFGKVTVASKSFEFGEIAVIGSFVFVITLRIGHSSLGMLAHTDPYR